MFYYNHLGDESTDDDLLKCTFITPGSTVNEGHAQSYHDEIGMISFGYN